MTCPDRSEHWLSCADYKARWAEQYGLSYTTHRQQVDLFFEEPRYRKFFEQVMEIATRKHARL